MKTLDAHPAGRRRSAVKGAAATATALAGLLGATLVVGATSATAAANPFERGPAPTTASIEASTGSFAVSKTSVSWVSGFGGGTIYYPTSTTAGTFGAVVVTPGFTERQSDMAWYGPRIASQGFVVFTIDTNTTLDQPDSRARQMLAALDYLTKSSTVKSRVDAGRTAVMGHSMGGGGSLEATQDRPSLKASIPLTPYDRFENFSNISVPTLIVGAENDIIASTNSHAKPFYNSLPASTKKAYLELNNAGHTSPLSPNTTIAKFSIAWLKRWVDNDTRYSPFLCNVSTSSAIQTYSSNCPF